MSAADLNISEEDRRRQAVTALRGYVYQVYASALAWTALDDDETLLLEVADDFAVLAKDALTTFQIKDAAASGAATLRDVGVIKTLNAFWRLRTDNPGRRVRAVFLTTAAVGREKGSPLPAGVKGLEHWRTMAREGADLSAFRALLSGLPLDPGLLAWLAEVPDDALQADLLRPVHWAYGQPALQGVDRLLVEHLTELCRPWGLRGEEVLKVRDSVLVAVLETIVAPAPRSLDRVRLHQTLDAASTVPPPSRARKHQDRGPGEPAARDGPGLRRKRGRVLVPLAHHPRVRPERT